MHEIKNKFLFGRWLLNMGSVGCLAGLSSLAVTSNVFASTGLIQVFEMAQQHDATLAQAKAQWLAQQQTMQLAKAPLLPQVSAGGGLVSQSSDQANSDTLSHSFELDLKQSLYNKGQWLQYEQAKYEVTKAKYTYQNAQQDLIERVVDAYFKALISQQDLELAKTKELADKAQWERAKTSAHVGLSSRTDVLQAKSSYDLSRSDRISSETNLDVALEELAKLTGRKVSDLKGLALNTQLPAFETQIETWLAKAKAGNYGLLQAKMQQQIAQYEVKKAKAGRFWPQVGMSAQLKNHTYDTRPNSTFYQNATTTTIGVQVTMPLYSGGGVSAQIAQSRANLQASEAGTRNVADQVALNVRILLSNIERGQSLVEALREAVKSSDAFLEAAEEGYRVGTKSLLEVLTARTNRFQARRNLTEALHNLVRSQIKLEGAVGQLTPETLQKYNALLADQS